jgi:MSHA pilin protein MshA
LIKFRFKNKSAKGSNMKSIKNLPNKQQGFTLIELVVVIVILGILAVTAAPKFIDLQDDAETATLQAVKASMQSASAMVHSKSLIAGNETSAATTVKVNGDDVAIAYGYPVSEDDTVTAAVTWAALLEVSDFDIFTDATNKTVVVAPKSLYADITAVLAASSVCSVTYTEASGTADTERETYVVKDC